MEFVAKPLAGSLLQNAHINCIGECSEIKAAIAYAQHSTDKILVFDDCLLKGKKLTFFGRTDGTCPVDLRILSWFLNRRSPNAICRLVPHWLHAKVIWWVGMGAYVGSANLTDRAWFQNFEAGVFMTHEELEQAGMTLELEAFFDGLEQSSFSLDQEEYDRQVKQEKRRAELLRMLREIDRGYEDDHWKLKDRTTPISVAANQKTKDRRLAEFAKEWGETLQLIRNIGARAALDENRPAWISADVSQGVQGDQFLHAYYYQVVKPHAEKDAYMREFDKQRRNPEAALQAALAWWKSGDYHHSQEEDMIYVSARNLRELLGNGRIESLAESEWIDALTRIHAFGDHASKVNNLYLGLGEDPGSSAKSIAMARMLWSHHAANGMSAPQVIAYVIWGPGEIAERIWRGSHDRAYKLPHIGANILGEMVGWARPSEFPPRNSRTSKALRSLGNEVQVVV